MTFIIGGVVASVVVLIIAMSWLRRSSDTSNMGQMSEQWLAETRNSHPS